MAKDARLFIGVTILVIVILGAGVWINQTRPKPKLMPLSQLQSMLMAGKVMEITIYENNEAELRLKGQSKPMLVVLPPQWQSKSFNSVLNQSATKGTKVTYKVRFSRRF